MEPSGKSLLLSIALKLEADLGWLSSYDSNSGGEREIQRTMLELLNQLDGFDSRGDVKVIMATNRIESLDPALIRPGRIDRKIEFPCARNLTPLHPSGPRAYRRFLSFRSLPDVKTKRFIFKIHTARMSLSDDVDLEEFVLAKDELSGADIKAVCTEAGLLALRERRMRVQMSDLRGAREKVLFRKKDEGPAGLCEWLPPDSVQACERLLTIFCVVHFVVRRPVDSLLYIPSALQPSLQPSQRITTAEAAARVSA